MKYTDGTKIVEAIEWQGPASRISAEQDKRIWLDVEHGDYVLSDPMRVIKAQDFHASFSAVN